MTTQTTTTQQTLDQWLADLIDAAEQVREMIARDDADADERVTKVRQVFSDAGGVESAWVRYAREQGMTGRDIAQSLMVSRATLYNRHGADD